MGIRTGFSLTVIGSLNALLKLTKGSLQEGGFILLFPTFRAYQIRFAELTWKRGLILLSNLTRLFASTCSAQRQTSSWSIGWNCSLFGGRGLSQVLYRGIHFSIPHCFEGSMMPNITTRSSSTSVVSEHLKTAKHHSDPDQVKILVWEPKEFFQKNLESHSHQKGKASPQKWQGVGFGSRMGSSSYRLNVSTQPPVGNDVIISRQFPEIITSLVADDARWS